MRRMLVAAAAALMIALTGCASDATMPDEFGKSAESAEQELKEAGFSNVNFVMENGMTRYIIDGFTVVSQKPEAGSQVKTNDEVVLTLKSTTSIESEAKRAESEERAKADDEAKASADAELAALVGKPAKDAYAELTSLGYTVRMNQGVSGLDWTDTVVKGAEDPANPNLVIKYEDFNSSKKTVTLVVDTQTNIDRASSAAATRVALEEKLPASYAWTAAESYGKAQYPYGFKLKDFMGRIAEEPKDESTWLLKAICNVTNENGEKAKDLVCEAEVTGTKDDPKVVSFLVY